MVIDCLACRALEKKRARIQDLFDLSPQQRRNALDIGEPDGFLSRLVDILTYTLRPLCASGTMATVLIVLQSL